MTSLFDNIPKIGLGLAALGRPEYINIGHDTDTKAPRSKELFKLHAFDVLDKAYELGIRYFDAARSYGIAEEILFDWKSKPPKKDNLLGSKLGYTYVADWNSDADVHEVKEHTIEKLTEQWNLSKLLKPELRLYQIHSATLGSGVLINTKVLDALWELKKSQKIFIGITTSGEFQNAVIDEALKINYQGDLLFDTYQMTFNILEQNILAMLPELILRNRKIIIKEALANGRLIPNTSYPNYERLYTIQKELSEKYQVTPDAIALRFAIDAAHADIVLSGAATIQHVTQNIKSLDFSLSNKEIEKLKTYAISPSIYWKERNTLAWN